MEQIRDCVRIKKITKTQLRTLPLCLNVWRAGTSNRVLHRVISQLDCMLFLSKPK